MLVNEPVSPPMLFCPVLVDDSFERSFRDNLHNKLLLRKKSSTIKQSEKEARSVRQASPAQLSSMVDDARVAIGARESRVTVPARELTSVLHNDDKIIVHGRNRSVGSSKNTKKHLVPITQIRSLLRRKVSTLPSIRIGKSFV